jgi:hypothetical protein
MILTKASIIVPMYSLGADDHSVGHWSITALDSVPQIVYYEVSFGGRLYG